MRGLWSWVLILLVLKLSQNEPGKDVEMLNGLATGSTKLHLLILDGYNKYD